MQLRSSASNVSSWHNPDLQRPLELGPFMAAGRALRVEKPALSASHSVSEINVNLATRLEAARKRVARIGRHGCGDVIEATLETPAQIIDVSPGGQERS